jgi:hypothetical protein
MTSGPTCRASFVSLVQLHMPLMGAGRHNSFWILMPVSHGSHLREDLTLGQKETPVCREGVPVGHPRHEVYGLG